MSIKNEQPARQTIQEVKTHHKIWLGSYILLALGCLAVHFILRMPFAARFTNYTHLLKRLFLGGFFVFTVLGISKYIETLVVRYKESKAIRYNLVRLIRILALLTVAMIIIAFLFENWYTAAVSLGLISLVLKEPDKVMFPKSNAR